MRDRPILIVNRGAGPRSCRDYSAADSTAEAAESVAEAAESTAEAAESTAEAAESTGAADSMAESSAGASSDEQAARPRARTATAMIFFMSIPLQETGMAGATPDEWAKRPFAGSFSAFHRNAKRKSAISAKILPQWLCSGDSRIARSGIIFTINQLFGSFFDIATAAAANVAQT